MNTNFSILKCLLCVLLIGGCCDRPEEREKGAEDKNLKSAVRQQPVQQPEDRKSEREVRETVKTAPAVESPRETALEVSGAADTTFQPSAKATEIVRKSEDLMRGDSLEGLYTMKVVTPGWTREIKMRVWDKNRTKTFIRILKPAKEEGIGTLRMGDEMWNYLPKVEQTIKIPPSMMGQSWMGSDFANDDLVNETSVIDDYTHGIIAEKEVDGQEVYVIELSPKEGAAVPWGKLLFTIRKDDLIPLKEEYYSERGELIKTLEYSRIWEMSGRRIPTIWKMISHTRDGHYTIIDVKDAQYNQKIPDDIFTLRNLKHVR